MDLFSKYAAAIGCDRLYRLCAAYLEIISRLEVLAEKQAGQSIYIRFQPKEEGEEIIPQALGLMLVVLVKKMEEEEGIDRPSAIRLPRSQQKPKQKG